MANKSSNNFGPLTFSNTPKAHNSEFNHSETMCLLCDDSFNLQICFDIFLKHLFKTHNLVIEDVQNISNLHDYLTYWREKFKTIPMEECIPSLKMDSTNHNYFLLSTLLKEDKELRHKLNLDFALNIQEFERSDQNFLRQCLFCKLIFEGSRPDFLKHLSVQHNLQLGNPQNLVFIEELIDKIDGELHKLKCIYCDKIFPERSILKEHMRKKLHKRINSKNTDYDKFYIVNYLEMDKTWQTIQTEDDHYAITVNASEQNSDEEYSDWNGKEDLITCLFCQQKFTHINTACLHLNVDHDFDFIQLTNELDFYQKIKLINYFRRQIHQNCCVYCQKSFDSNQILQIHMYDEDHCKLPDSNVFDQPEFYFSTYENDAFLYLIDDMED